jgi:hypothetical protein
LVKTEGNQEIAAAKAGMDAKTARKYRRLGQVLSELAAAPRWRTRQDPFVAVWEEVRELLEVNTGLEAKTVFEYLQRRYPGHFEDGQLRTLQRRVKIWRAQEENRSDKPRPQDGSSSHVCGLGRSWFGLSGSGPGGTLQDEAGRQLCAYVGVDRRGVGVDRVRR